MKRFEVQIELLNGQRAVMLKTDDAGDGNAAYVASAKAALRDIRLIKKTVCA